MAALAGERPGQGHEIAGRRLGAAIGIRVPGVEKGKEPGEGRDVLGVVIQDRPERLRRAAPHEVEVASGDLPPAHVAVAVDSQQLALDGAEARVAQAVPEETPDGGKEVEHPRVWRRRAAVETVASHQQWPVEAAAVVGDEPGVGRDGPLQLGQQGRLLAVVRADELEASQLVALPPAEPHQEGERPGRGAETRRLRVEADEPGGGPWLARQAGQPLADERDGQRRRLHAHHEPAVRGDHLPG